MNISSVNGASFVSLGGGGSIDEEYKKILEKLMALGITPSGNKSTDKAKLREYEMRQLKAELGSNGRGVVNKANYLTISSEEIDRIRQKLQDKADEEEPEFKEKKEACENKTGAEQQALLNQHFLVKKKRYD